MANIKISELPAATLPLAGSELVPIVQSGTTDQVTVANLTAGRTVSAAAVTATGTVSGATVIASGTVSGATVAASGTVSGATVTATGTVSGATVTASNAVSGATVVAGAGTAAAPSISPTGDSNTGIFFPAADTIAFAEGGVEALRLDSSSNATFAGTAVMASSFLRNRIINGDCRIDQRTAGASVTVGPSLGSVLYTLDRWYGFATSTRTFTVQRSTTAPAGFVNSAQLTVGVSGSPSAAEQIFYGQSIEGFNTADLGWGTANAQTVTVSFWVRSSVTGTYSFGVLNSGGTRSYIATYSIAAANTWEYKTITIPGDTTGTWLTDNSVGVVIRFDLGSGSNFNGTAGAWSGSFFWRTSGSVNWISNAGATWNVTGVQFEVGSAATPFERRQFGQELALCQRYFFKTYNTSVAVAAAASDGQVFTMANNGGTAFATCSFAVDMRAAPTVVLYNSSTGAAGTWRDGGGTDRAMTASSSGTRQTSFFSTTVTASSSVGGQLTAAAEL